MLRKHVPILLTLLLLIAAGSHDPAGSAGEGDRSGTPSGVDRQDQSLSPSRLYEAVSGYIDGIRGKPQTRQEKPADKPAKQRRDPESVKKVDQEPRRILEREKSLSRSRMQRGEWGLAVSSLERALEAAARLQAVQEREELEKMLREARSRASDESSKTAAVPGEITNAVGMRLAVLPPGTFSMGSSRSERRRMQAIWSISDDLMNPEGPAHQVRLSTPFLIGKYEVTAGQFKQFVEETGYRTVAEKKGWGWVYDKAKKHWAKRSGASWRNPGTEVWEDHPVTMICRADADAFCEWLSKKDGRKYHLPTEAQWEYAARGGKEKKHFPWGNEYPDGKKLNMADYRSPFPWADRTVDDRHAGPAPVGAYEPNGFWLYDMMGNVWEICSDVYGAKEYDRLASDVATDPTGPRKGKKTVVRGGNWAFGAAIARNAFRTGIDSDLCSDIAGFRVAAEALPGETPKDASRAKASDEPPLDDTEISRLLEHVKSLVAAGRRVEARRLVDDLTRSGSYKKGTLEKPADFVKETLDTLIDLTEDQSRETFTNSLSMKMVRIPGGAFVMGSSEADIAWAMSTLTQGQPISLENEYPYHKVRISRPFFISATEVTCGQFDRFVKDTGYITDAEDAGGGQVFDARESRFERKEGSSWKNPGWTISADQPVAMVSYNDAQAFVEWLTAKEKLPYKLPTEAQWEYAARGGLPMAQFPWGDDSPDGRRANYADKNTDFEWRDREADDGYKYVAPVGTYEPNNFGLYDMAGNVLEWVRDYYGEDYYRYTPEIDPEGPGHGENRVTKGGEWTFGPVNLRCAFRGWSRPDLAFFNTGFRVVIDTAVAVRPLHFAENFLTREWVPGPDQRAVAEAVAKEKERRVKTSRGEEGTAARQQIPDAPVVRGVIILDFTPKSDARKAGMKKGDVIVEYNGTSDLTSDKFLALTAQTRKERVTPTLVFIREGYEHKAKVARGFLGISIMDTNVRGPFKKAAPRERPSPRDDKKKRSKPLDWT